MPILTEKQPEATKRRRGPLVAMVAVAVPVGLAVLIFVAPLAAPYGIRLKGYVLEAVITDQLVLIDRWWVVAEFRLPLGNGQVYYWHITRDRYYPDPI